MTENWEGLVMGKYNILTDVKVISELELKSLKGKQPFVQHALQEGAAA
ncbi:MAG: hypothetical protein L6247_09055 [Desulfobacteraceae bacterium]|nr:hypothetical protein [Pseudomonadota bacterium]MBU4463731.1 hypothetical protein [Pseudomonadota bacterium]MCG2755692.1 hypothetical protein [Desulfobacteraceae bacterium]